MTGGGAPRARNLVIPMAMNKDANTMTAMILGAVLVLVGLLGFVPALTPDGLLLGIFGVNALHNVVHLLTGAVLLGAVYMQGGQYVRVTNITLGSIYILVALVNFIAPSFSATLLGTQPIVLNPDAFLHLFLGVVLLGVAFMAKTETTRPMTRSGI